MKKAQFHSQIFTYILTLVVVAAVLLFGYSVIKDVLQKSDEATVVALKTNLERDIKSISPDFGSVKKGEYNLGTSQEICFVESQDNPVLTGLSANPFIVDAVQDETGDNVFLIENNALTRSFALGKIAVDPDILCFAAPSANVVLRLEGRGDHVLISPWT